MGDFSAPDREVARLAARQHRVVNTRQLRESGLGEKAVRHRVERGRMTRMWHGVYLVGPGRPETLSVAMGGVLSIEPDGTLADDWAGWLWGFMPKPALPVTVAHTGGTRRGPRPVRPRRTRALDATRMRNIPVTTPARTLLDLAGRDDIERLVAEAQVVGVVRERQLHEVVARYPTHRNAARLRATLADGPMLSPHESEQKMFALLRAAGLPRPETGATLGRYKPDFLYRDQRLIIEVDGWSAHHHRRAFENDRKRGAELTSLGYRVMHVTYRQLTDEPIAVAARIAAALAV